MKKCINPNQLPTLGGPYSQVISAGSLVFLAGMLPVDANGQVVGDNIETQTRKTLENMKVALEAVGGGLSDVCTVTTYLTNLERDFDGYNKVYREFFHTEPPARATVSAGLVDNLVEIQAIAVLD
jgi:reactive intermediate/imine deaminase